MKTKHLLTDFNLPRWKNTDMMSVNNIIQKLNTSPFYGELEHPIDMSKDDIIDLNNAVVQISNLSLEENRCYGDVEFLENEKGAIAQDIIQRGGRFSIRASAVGNNTTGIKFKEIVTWDVLTSTP